MGSRSFLPLTFFLVLVWIPPSGAQGLPQNKLHIWDGSTEFTGRPLLGKGSGHLSQGFPPSVVRGQDRLSLIQYVLQDQDLKTSEPWDVKICPLDARGKPDYARGVAVLKGMRLQVGKGMGAFLITHRRNSSQNGPISLSRLKDANNRTLLDPDETFHLAWNLTKKANWTLDGISLHYSQAGTRLPNGGRGQLTCWGSRFHREIPRPEKFRASDPTLQIIERLAWGQERNQVQPGFLNLSWRLELGFVEPTLQGGAHNPTYNNRPCRDPNEGYAALDPDFNNTFNAFVQRYDDYRWRLEAGTGYGGGVGLLFFSESVLPSPVKFTGVRGSLSLDPGGKLFALGPFPIKIGSLGTGEFTLALSWGNSPLRKGMIALPALHAQALVVKPGKPLWLSSLWAFRPLVKPAGFNRGVTTSGTPLVIPRTAARSRFFLRNDGPGVVRIVNYVGSNRIGPITRVPERTAVQVLLPSKARRIQVETKKTSGVDVVYR